jgi:hypothetical protein
MLDIFKSDAFGVVRLTQSINNLSFVPGRLGELGLFEVDRVDTTAISIEKKGDILTLVPPTPRGGPGTTLDKELADIRMLSVPHFEINDAVMAEEVQNVRAFGQGDGLALESVMRKVAQRQRYAVNSFAATEEFARVGAVIGVITYQGGKTLDLFSEFGVSQIAEIAFDLSNASAVDGALRKACAGVTRTISNELGGVPFTGIHALCGDNFFDDLLSNKEVRKTFDGWSEAKILREGYIGPNRSSYGMFEFGGIVWENYRGKVGTTDYIDTNKCHLFPVGVPGLFRTYYAPADWNETVNTLGRRLYAKQYDMANGKGVNLDTQMNALNICTRPKVLIKGKRT